ncbi:MAG: carboxypeptidase-like regulatory domain-containing protein [Fuerstiella sp.]|nr:carboxypeptidase-like regulatory domain-containing protein [Fuerstiella sp.]
MRTVISWVLLTALLVSPSASFADASGVQANSAERVELSNVELAKGEVLNGQLVNNAGQPLAGVAVTLQIAKSSHQVVTDKAGRFAVAGLRGGQCIITIGDKTFACRLWTNGTAPPRSLKSIALVNSKGEDTLVRGQGLSNRIRSLTRSQQIALGALVIGGTALAVALAQNDAS